MKNILKKLLISTILVGLGIFVFGQKSDTKSKNLLDAVTKNYKANKNNYFKFAYGSGANGKITKTQTGIYYTSGNLYKLKIMDIEQIFDGSKIYNISTEDQEVTIAKPNGSEMMFSPTNYLNLYNKDYNAEYVGKRNINKKNTDVVKLTPVKDNGIKNVYIYIDSTKNQLVKIEQFSSNNDISVITVQDYRVNQTLNNDSFKFNKSQYKDYLITEL